jgi:hypothetical protein
MNRENGPEKLGQVLVNQGKWATERGNVLIKGTVARNFLPLGFSTNRPHIVPEFTP